MPVKIKHATNWNGNDVTLCGLANEASDDGDATSETENPEYAQVGEYVTCIECQRVIDHVHGLFSSRNYFRRC